MNLFQKKQRYYLIWNNRVTLLLAILIQHKITFVFVFQTFLQLPTRSFTINTMQFTMFNNRTRCTLDYGPDSVVLSVKDIDENLTISFLGIPPAASSLLLSQRQDLLHYLLPRVTITPNQQRTFKLREEIFSSVGAKDTDSRGYEVSDLEDIEVSWEDPVAEMDSVYQSGIDTFFFIIQLWQFSDAIDRCINSNSWR